MPETYFSLVTTVGLAKLAAAQAAGDSVDLTTLKAGDSGGAYRVPLVADLDVVGEVWSGSLNRIVVDDDNPARLVIEAIIPTDAGGFYVREAGVFDTDGDMIVICNLPETYKPALVDGSGKDLYIKIIVEMGNPDVVTLQIDPAVVMATREYVDDADASLQQQINDEVLTRSNSIQDEGQIRANADAILQENIDTEAQARANADAALVPAGAIMAFATEEAPAGWLECNGAAVSRTEKAALFAAIGVMYGNGDGATTFNIPDYRGRFLRGLDHGAGVDPDAADRSDRGDGTDGDHVGTGQADEFKRHTHDAMMDIYPGPVPGKRELNSFTTAPTSATGGNETRPVNISVLYCIKY